MQVLVVEERVEEHIHTYFRQVKHLRGHIKAERNRQQVEHRNQHHLHEVIEPGDKYERPFILSNIVLMLEPVGAHKNVNPLVAVLFEKVVTSHNQLENSQLEDPPDIDLQAKQAIPHNGDGKRDGRHDKRRDGVGIVTLRNLRPVAVDRSPLPEAEQHQKRRENQRYQAVRYEYDPERDDQQSHQHNRSVDPHSVIDLLAAVADQKRCQDSD